MLLLGFATMLSVCIVHMQAQESRGVRPPYWMRKVFLNSLTKYIIGQYMGHKKWNVTRKTKTQKEIKQVRKQKR